jgi:PAS domain S-box-containing protein
MDISLDQTEKVISLMLGAISVFGILVRKWFVPKIKSMFGSIIYWVTVPKRLKALETFVRDATIKSLNKSVPEIHSMLYILKHKCDFLLKDCSTPMYECDLNGRCIWINGATRDLFGLEEAQMMGDGWLNALHPDDIRPTHDKWNLSVKKWVPYKSRYRIINQTTDKVILCEASAVPIYDENEIMLSYLGKIEVLDQ